MDNWSNFVYEQEQRSEWIKNLPDGVPCDHIGCLSHVTHPCDGCGRIGGKRQKALIEKEEKNEANIRYTRRLYGN